MAGFFNPFRSAPSRDRRPRRCPRYAIESLETRLSPSDFGLATMEVSTMPADMSSTSASTPDATEISVSNSMDMISNSDSMALISNSGSLAIDSEPPPPDGDGTPPYTPPNTGGGPSGPA